MVQDPTQSAAPADVQNTVKPKFIKCPRPFCSANVREDRVFRHLKKAHKLIKCLRCPNAVLVREDHFSEHMKKCHSDITACSSSEETRAEICSFLESSSYEVRSFDNFIVARPKKLGKIYLIKIENAEGYTQYNKMTTVVMTSNRFKTYVNKLGRLKISRANVTGLRRGVITPFGWHAWELKSVRYPALDYASIYEGEECIFHLLGWMRNTWPKNSNLDQYGDVVKSDYKWFEMERVSASYNKGKRELIGKLEHELFSLGIPLEFQRFFKKFYEIDHWFVIICLRSPHST
ncbi:MAG: hypothetical protein ABSE15_03845 [Candidatus Bathyarchaeia archaeon]